MKIISHRGNLYGSQPNKENSLDYIYEAHRSGYDVEIDVWYSGGSFYLGHDKPTYWIEEESLEDETFWCHAKNLDALYRMLKNGNIHCFWHQNDNFTVTSKGYIWTYPNNPVTENSIIVDLSCNWTEKPYNCYGVCTDWIKK